MSVTARIGAETRTFSWVIEYDDATRNITTIGTGTGFCLVTVQITAAITRTVAYIPQPGARSIRADLAARMDAADFTIISDGSVQTLASNIPPAQVSKILGKGTIAGLPSSSECSLV